MPELFKDILYIAKVLREKQEEEYKKYKEDRLREMQRQSFVPDLKKKRKKANG